MNAHSADRGRPLGPAETVMWHLDGACPVNAIVIARISGPVTETSLRNALDRLQERHPLLRMKVVRSRHSFAFSPENVPPIPFQWTHAAPELVDEIAGAEFNIPIRPVAGPLIRCHAVSHGPASTSLIIVVNHAVLDGLSSFIISQDLCKALGGALTVPPPGPVPPLEQCVPVRFRGTRGFFAYLALLWRLARQLMKFRNPDRFTRGIQISPSQRRFGFVNRTLDREFSIELLAAARRNGLTVHGLISSALLQAITEQNGSTRPVVCATLTNLRPMLDLVDPRSVGLFVSSLPTFHRPQPGASLIPLGLEVSRAIHDGKRNGDDLVLGTGSNRWFGWLARRIWWKQPDRFAKFIERANFGSVGISNLGILDGERSWGPIRLEAFNAVVSPSVFNPLLVTTGTVLDRFIFNTVYVEPFYDRYDAQELADNVIRKLQAACR